MKRAVLVALGVSLATAASAQNYRARIDGSMQAVSFRGLVPDSIPAADVVTGPDGGPETPDGFAVRCGAGDHCHYFRPGAPLRGVPMSMSASVAMWGLRVEGLSFRATGRLLGDLGDDAAWPATRPSAQLVEGFLEYQRDLVTARAGRQLVTSRLEPFGFDGGWVRTRWDAARVEVTGYAGWGLGQAAAVSVVNPALNPLDEWRPRDRQIVAGAEAAWFVRGVDARAEYRREVDPANDYFVSERTALSVAARAGRMRATGGVDYNIAEGHFGTSDLTLSYLRSWYSVTAGARHYRPYFSLWTLWGAFSPVPYNAVHASAQVRATSWLVLDARGESYRYDDAEVSTALVQGLENGGWRANARATARVDSIWTVEASYGQEHGPGAAGSFADAAVTFTPGDRYSFDLYGGSLARPLELRFYDATSRWIGGRGELSVGGHRRLWADVSLIDDARDRPDAAASSLSQVRVRSGFSVAFGSGADRRPLPPARPLR
ncbi:MAG TPA: hypothetical protein VFO55_05920 [Gemmatimonadaceae bacterium]|nr:hypothetical protein [Gemmatimonadaceae bacterium]